MQKRLFGILASIAIVAAACGGATPSSAPAETTAPGASGEATAPPESNLADEQVLRINLGSEDPATLDPNMAQDSSSLAVLNGLNRGLVYFDKDLQVVPAAAESYEVSPDAKTITFRLRDGIKYSNGDPIVAGDFVYSWRRLIDPRLGAPYAYVMEDVKGGPELLELAEADPLPSDADIDAALQSFGVAAPDTKTFVVTLGTPATYFLSVAAMWLVVPVQESWATAPNFTEAGNYVSSGPYMLDTWDHNSRIILKPNPNWYGDIKPTVDVHFQFGDVTTAMAAYEAGEIDMVSVPPEDLRRVVDDPNLKSQVQDRAQAAITYYGYNTAKSPTSNLNFRIALTQSIDKQAFIDATFGGTGEVANTFIMPGIPGYQPDLNPYPYDPEAAKQRLATALKELGVADAAALGKIKIGFNSGSGHEPRVAFLTEAWRTTLGLEFDQVGLEFPTFLGQRHKGEFIVSRNGWGADYLHANNQLQGLFTCGGGNNDEQWCNEQFDALLKQAAVEPDQAKQVALYHQAQTILIEEAVILPLRFANVRYLVQPYVGGLQATTADSQLPGDTFYETIQILKH